MADTFTLQPVPPLLPLLDPAKRTMYRTIKTNGLTESLSKLTNQAPVIIAANQRLAGYLPTSIRHPYHDTALFTVCLRDAIKAAFADDVNGQGDLTAYFAVLLERAALVLRYDLINQHGRWDPLYGEPLHVWLKNTTATPTQKTAAHPINKISLSTFIPAMYQRLVPEGAIPSIQQLGTHS